MHTPTLRHVSPYPPGRLEPRLNNEKKARVTGGAPREHPLSVAVQQGCSLGLGLQFLVFKLRLP